MRMMETMITVMMKIRMSITVWMMKMLTAPLWPADVLTKEEFQLRQSVEPFVHYKEKTATFEVISREKIEDVAAKVGCVPQGGVPRVAPRGG